ncbi:Meckelin (Transmembrane protein 67) [Novymonas esmeraldas]|uniref:Meckelin (Transmembrane protein 67) n=1 Tax=Novymonas esmeraldas TaxID=1808958 RepID=A0AAW0EZ07_9TRYP
MAARPSWRRRRAGGDAVRLLLVVLACCSVAAAAQRGGECDAPGFTLGVADRSCQACPAGAQRVQGSCVCSDGSALLVDAGTGAMSCVDCAAQRMMVSVVGAANASSRCLPCGGAPQLSCLTDATYDAAARTCVCAAGSVVVQQVGAVTLSAAMCAACATPACVTCPPPYVLDSSSGQCRCGSGFTLLYDGSCVPTAAYQAMVAAAAGTSVMLAPPNIDNSNAAGSTTTLTAAQTYSVGAAVLCSRGNSTACNLLANLCVLMNYHAASTPCTLYRHLKQSLPCGDPWCETADGLPWLYYTRSNADVLGDAATEFRATARQELHFVVSAFDLYGNWLGYQSMMSQLNPCFLANTELDTFYAAGDTRATSCHVNWRWFLRANRTVFYDVYLRDPSNASRLMPVPLLVDYSSHEFSPVTLNDAWLYRAGAVAPSGAAVDGGLRRRFYAYDNVGGAGGGDAPRSTLTSYITTLRSASLVLGTDRRDDRYVSTPLFVLQYASKMTSTIAGAAAADPLGAVRQAPLNVSGGWSAYTLRCAMRAYYLASTDSVSHGMRITLIVLCGVCLLSAWARAYGWMRRRQYLVLDWLAALRFFVYLCDHISNLFFVVVAIASWYIFIAYKSQASLSRAVRVDDVYVNAMLYVAVAGKGVTALYRLVEQCNADYFVIDWERSKGQLLRENKIVPVSMWRSTFLANELNELQALRYWRPLLTMALIFLFLVGLDYESMSASVPRGSRDVGGMTTSLDTLRIAVDTFFWVAVALVLYVLEYQIYYRFLVVHPLQAFVDLCSVSNISIMILVEQQWGFYIHGESIHAHADVSMEEFQNNLFLEAQGNLPVRGLGGQSQCQSFEVFLGPYTRQYLYMCYLEMHLEHQRTLGKRERAINPAQWHYVRFLFGFSRKPRVYSQTALAIRDRINHAFQQSVRRAESTLLVKFVLQKWLDFPPNVMYMNGPQRGDQGGKDLFFIDDVQSYGRAFLCGLDFDLFVLYAALFAAIDASLHNVYAAMVLTFSVEIVVYFYRIREGLINLSQKTMIDDRFFI